MKATTYPKISIRKGREWQLQHGHPWLFSGAISQAPKADPGSIVDLVDTDGRFIARGYYNPNCDIAVRVLSRESTEEIDGDFFKRRLLEASELRKLVISGSHTNVFRLVNAEADFLPGFIIDYFDGTVVIQSHTAGADRLLEECTRAVQELVRPQAVIIRNDAGVRRREGLQLEQPRVVSGSLPESGEIVVQENSLRFAVDPMHGQKTGFFTDQREKRLAVSRYCENLPDNAQLLNCFSYSASFSIYACRSRPLRTVNVDQSEKALEQAKRNFELNSLPVDNHEFICADAFDWMQNTCLQSRTFDFTILDPPAFAKSHKDKARALKAYTRMDKLGIQLTKPGGIMVTCSCSGPVTYGEFVNALREAAGDSTRRVQILETYSNGPDHPVNVAAAETNYLKVLFCRVL